MVFPRAVRLRDGPTFGHRLSCVPLFEGRSGFASTRTLITWSRLSRRPALGKKAAIAMVFARAVRLRDGSTLPSAFCHLSAGIFPKPFVMAANHLDTRVPPPRFFAAVL